MAQEQTDGGGLPAAQPTAKAGPAWLAAVVIAVACACVYAGKLGGPFVFDDQQAIVDNPTIGSVFSAAVLRPPIETPVAGRPLTNLTFALDRARAGLAPAAFHATNLLLHMLVSLVAFAVLRRALAAPRMPASLRERALPLSFAAALLFTVHPMAVEVVLYTTQRSESLAALCYLSALLLLLCAAEQGAARLVLPMAAVGLLGVASKETFVTAPVVLLCFDRAFLAGSFAGALRARKALHLALLASWLPLLWLQKGGTRPGSVRGLELDYLLAQAKIVPSYFATALFPARPVFDYGPLLHSSAKAGWPWLVALVLVAVAVAVLAWTYPRLGFPGFWVLCTLAPTSSMLSIHTEVGAERRFYLALPCVLAVVVIGIAALPAWSRARSGSPAALRSAALGALLTTTLLLGLSARAYAAQFANLGRLWRYAALARPENPRAPYNLAETLRRSSRLREAEIAYRRALAINPSYLEARQNLGGTLLQLGRIDEALVEIGRSVQAAPNDVQARFNYGLALGGAGHMAEAAAQLSEVVRRTPGLIDARIKLAVALHSLHRDAEARRQLQWLSQHAPADPRTRQALRALSELLAVRPAGQVP